jgi:hypothetical protein
LARTRALSRLLAEQRREIERLEAELHRVTIERVIDLEVAMGIKGEKERSQEFLQMADPRKYPLEALEHLRGVMLLALVRINNASEGSRVQDQNQPNVGYIQ